MRRNAGIALTIMLLLLHATTPSAHADNHSTSNMMGTLGLNMVPSARMDHAGTLRMTVARTGPYTQAVAGLQLTDRLYLGLRQTSLADNLLSKPDALYPGMDVKLRLFNERLFRPEISVGLQGALGRNVLSGQYLALSKRFENWDVTGGFGWGRFGTRQTFRNPVLFHNTSNTHWFQGPMGVFGGAQYNMTPEFALKADWSSDDWNAETRKRLDPWALGFSYRPVSWLDTGVAWNTGSGAMARVSFTPNLADWTLRPAKPAPITKSFQSLGLNNIKTVKNTIQADLILDSTYPTPEDIGRAVRELTFDKKSPPDQIAFHLYHNGLRGPDILLNSHDLEEAMLTHNGSNEEIWHSTDIGYDLLPPSSHKKKFLPLQNIRFDLQNDMSLSENDNGLLGRAALIASQTTPLTGHFITTNALRLNLADNLSGLNRFRGLHLWPVREDIDVFTQNRVLLERSAVTALTTLGQNFHLAGSIGYLEEMYGGLSGEILYRPFAKPWAIGLETALALKRDPYTAMGLGFVPGNQILTGHLNGYYEIPDSTLTLHGSIGRYLAGDVGTTIDLTNRFDNGVEMGATATLTNRADTDIVNGGHTNAYAGLSLSLPFGSLPFVPDGSRMLFNAAPLGRQTGQRLQLPSPLYAATEPLSYRHITQHWSQLMTSK